MGRYITDGPVNLIVDLSGIDFLDSSGLGALVQLVKKAKEVDGSLHLIANPRVLQTIKMVRLEKFLSIQPSLEAALEKLNSES